MARLVKKYVWELPVRATHWINFFSIVILSVSGLFIGAPFSIGLDPSSYAMGQVRFIHFVTAHIFTISVLSRIYWAFVGNNHANWRVFFPYVNEKGRRDMILTLRYYLFMTRKAPHVVGHNSLAGATYLLVFILFFVQIISGFAVYVQYTPGSLLYGLFGWIANVMAIQTLRLVHDLVMWLIIAFAIHHVYSAWLMDTKEKSGLMSSIFGGYKTIEEE